MLQGVGVQLGQYAVERPALSPQTVHFLQQLQEMGQRIEALERRSAKLETGRRYVSDFEVKALAAALGVTVGWLLGSES